MDENIRPITDLECMSRYIHALKNHDWWFEFSEDFAVYSRGKEALLQLHYQRKQLDPDASIWNIYCNQNFRLGLPAEFEQI